MLAALYPCCFLLSPQGEVGDRGRRRGRRRVLSLSCCLSLPGSHPQPLRGHISPTRMCMHVCKAPRAAALGMLRAAPRQSQLPYRILYHCCVTVKLHSIHTTISDYAKNSIVVFPEATVRTPVALSSTIRSGSLKWRFVPRAPPTPPLVRVARKDPALSSRVAMWIEGKADTHRRTQGAVCGKAARSKLASHPPAFTPAPAFTRPRVYLLLSSSLFELNPKPSFRTPETVRRHGCRDHADAGPQDGLPGLRRGAPVPALSLRRPRGARLPVPEDRGQGQLAARLRVPQVARRQVRDSGRRLAEISQCGPSARK